MGQSSSNALEAHIQDYKDLTYFTKKEILHAYKKFVTLIPPEYKNKHDVNDRFPVKNIYQLPELQENPFRDRICKVFSSEDDDCMSFEDFLDMMSTFSESAPKTVKAEYAFRIFDFDGDGEIGEADISFLLKRLTNVPATTKGSSRYDKEKLELTDDQIKQITEHILKEADLDEDKKLGYAEFEHAVSKSPDFTNCFRIRL